MPLKKRPEGTVFMQTLFYNVKLVYPDSILDGALLTEDGRIAALGARLEAPSAEAVDGEGLFLAPGFCDLHVHGGGGFSAMDPESANVVKMAEAHLRHGVTSILPTTLAAPIKRLQTSIGVIETAARLSKSARILGVHLEGPFLSPKKAGAQSPGNLAVPTKEKIEALLDCSPAVRMIGAAPELENGFLVGEMAAARGIVASVAHSDASFEVAEAALSHGYSDVTHLFSACSAMHKEGLFRQVGVAEAGLALDGYTTQFIGDLRHLPRGAVKLTCRCKGPDRAYLISDGLEYSGCDYPEGTLVSQENGQWAVIEDGVMKLADRSCLAGSVTTLDKMVKNLLDCGIPLTDAVKMASTTPLRVIGLGHRRGRLAPGFDADLVLFDENVNVKAVYVAGKRILMNS